MLAQRASILDRLCHMRLTDCICIGKIGNRARHLQHAMIIKKTALGLTMITVIAGLMLTLLKNLRTHLPLRRHPINMA
jgi:hypothetical protein